MLASNGETDAPWGAPTSLAVHAPSSITPADPFLDQSQDPFVPDAVLNELL
jgi:hypothetical protein